MTITVPAPPKPSWASQITTAEESGPPQSIFLYGAPGTRKTSIAASIAKVPGFKKILLIDVDNGTEVLSMDPEFAHIEIIKINALDPQAKLKLDSIISDVCANDYGYDAVIFDTFDVGQDIAERFFKLQHKDSKNTFAIYGDLGQWSDDTMRKLHDAPHFVAIVTAHSQEKANDAGITRITPRLSGSSKDSIGGVPSLVAHLSFMEHPETSERHLVAIIGESDVTITKNRYRLGQSIVDMDLPKLYELINQKINHKSQSAVAA